MALSVSLSCLKGLGPPLVVYFEGQKKSFVCLKQNATEQSLWCRPAPQPWLTHSMEKNCFVAWQQTNVSDSLASPGLGSICLVLIASLAPFSFPTFGTTLTQGNTRLCQVVLGWAGPALRNTVTQPGYSCLCLFARSLLFSLSVFLIINVGLAGSPGWWKPQWKSVQTSASENAAGSVSARLGRQWQILLLRVYLKTYSHHNSPAGSSTLGRAWTSASILLPNRPGGSVLAYL